MLKGICWRFVCAADLSAAFIASAGDMTLIGTHPTSPLTSYPTIHALQAYEGRIYIGYGDWNEYPAVVTGSYDPASRVFRLEHSSPSDSIGKFRVIGGDLYVPSIDPVHFEEFRHFSVLSQGRWRSHTPVDMFQVFDVATLNGTDLWMVGASYNSGAAVFRSMDGGNSWDEVTLPASSLGTYYYCFPLRGRLYVEDAVYDGVAATTNSPLPFARLHKPTTVGTGTNEFLVALSGSTLGVGGPARYPVVTFDTKTWRTLKADVYDFTVKNGELYTLQYNPVARTNQIAVTTSLSATQLTSQVLAIAGIPADAKALEILDGVAYVGDAQGRLWAAQVDGTPVSGGPAGAVNMLPDAFGRALAIDGSTMVVGAPDFSAAHVMAGQVSIWNKSEHGEWSMVQTLESPQPSFSGWFGKDVAIAGSVCAILEAGRDLSRKNRGSSSAVHLYERTPAGWQHRQTLSTSYVHSVAVQSNLLVVGASEVASSERLYIYDLARGPGVLSATLRTSFPGASPSDPLYEPTARVAAQGNTIVWGLCGDFGNGGPGLVKVYERDSNGNWIALSTIRNSGGYQPDAFGFSVAVKDDWLAVGAPRTDAAAPQAGAVHLYQRTTNATAVSYALRQTIQPPLSQAESDFGSSVALAESHLVVGAPGVNHADEFRKGGAVHVYRRIETNWVWLSEVARPSGADVEFGSRVAAGDRWLAAGCRASRASTNILDRLAIEPFARVSTDADLQVTVAVTPMQAALGTSLSYRVLVTNDGPADASSVMFTFDTPSNSQFISAALPGGSCENAAGQIRCSLPALPAGTAAQLNVVAEFRGSPCEIALAEVSATAAESDPFYFNNQAVALVNNFPPEISIVSPTNGSNVRYGGPVEIVVEAQATNGLRSVEIYAGTELIATLTNAPYRCTWASYTVGTKYISARAIDQCGLQSLSIPIALTVVSNQLPLVAFTTPLHGARYPATNSILIDVSASDPDGWVAEVHLFDGTNRLAVLQDSPYQFVWTGVAEGRHNVRAIAIDDVGAMTRSSSNLVVVGPERAGVNWVAYNDHATGPASHPFATSWNVLGFAPGASGALRSISDGVVVPAGMALTRARFGVSPQGFAAAPAAGTPAASLFGGFIDFTNGSEPNIGVLTSSWATCTFTGLDPKSRYNFRGTAIALDSDKWLSVELAGAASFTPAHSSGCLTQGIGTIASNQVVINTGYNIAGDVVGWDNIAPDQNGTFALTWMAYTNQLADGSFANARNAFALTAMRLEETTMMTLATPLVNQTVSPGTAASFTAVPRGMGPFSYKWYHNNSLIEHATNATLVLGSTAIEHAGEYKVLIGDAEGNLFHSSAVLTLLSIPSKEQLFICGPVGQRYRIDYCDDLAAGGEWSELATFTMNSSSQLQPTPSTGEFRFYRVMPIQ